jgi:hypothetical protein
MISLLGEAKGESTAQNYEAYPSATHGGDERASVGVQPTRKKEVNP